MFQFYPSKKDEANPTMLSVIWGLLCFYDAPLFKTYSIMTRSDIVKKNKMQKE